MAPVFGSLMKVLVSDLTGAAGAGPGAGFGGSLGAYFSDLMSMRGAVTGTSRLGLAGVHVEEVFVEHQRQLHASGGDEGRGGDAGDVDSREGWTDLISMLGFSAM